MTLTKQIFLGALILMLGAAVHITLLVVTINVMKEMSGIVETWGPLRTWIVMMTTGFGVVLIGHSAQIWMWAFALRAVGALHLLEDAVYFSLVTTSTLGYGDITLPRTHRIFGAIASVAGLLTFGFSTAFLINLMQEVLRQHGII